MVLAVAFLIIAIIVALIFIPKLKKQQDRKAVVVFTILLLIGTALNMGIALKVHIPSPLDLITFIFTPIRDYIVSFTK
ncbi:MULTISPECIES: hypothetical protein [Lysinibacillus]|uniref:Histidine kinase n=1 Tax=Lysinibacillus boronitolerans JCM 21713 = 10a = NBRC 103108 TaxID=1294264 RepID=A0ABR4XWN9_9BACI|nr:hypothetical protein [Lysinibacillus boronitolerans]KGR83151.1 hypothetical protein CD31_17370 [Lysinibacillus boronitolerans JCM 21713 = 10a = NBRC 103108]MCS1391736.1 hypothetical protein [Lysinibacillus boronitolerans]